MNNLAKTLANDLQNSEITNGEKNDELEKIKTEIDEKMREINRKLDDNPTEQRLNKLEHVIKSGSPKSKNIYPKKAIPSADSVTLQKGQPMVHSKLKRPSGDLGDLLQKDEVQMNKLWKQTPNQMRKMGESPDGPMANLRPLKKPQSQHLGQNGAPEQAFKFANDDANPIRYVFIIFHSRKHQPVLGGE